MTLDEFREATKEMPGDAEIMILIAKWWGHSLNELAHEYKYDTQFNELRIHLK